MPPAKLLGCLATRFPKTDLTWDTKAVKVTNNDAANAFVRKTYRIPSLKQLD